MAMTDETGMTVEARGDYRVQYKHYTEHGVEWKTAYEGNDIERAERIFRSQTEQRFEVKMLDRDDKKIREFVETHDKR
jgi:hypothetical protein